MTIFVFSLLAVLSTEFPYSTLQHYVFTAPHVLTCVHNSLFGVTGKASFAINPERCVCAVPRCLRRLVSSPVEVVIRYRQPSGHGSHMQVDVMGGRAG